MATKSLAIDIVLFLPPAINEEMIALSNHLNDVYGEKNRLNMKDRFPHISLLMGVIEEKDVVQFTEILQDLAQRFLPMELGMHELKSKISSSAIELTASQALSDLQASLLTETSHLVTHNPSAEMFYEEPTEKNIEWVRNYATSSHNPHITVGPVFEKETYTDLKTFTVTTLALCHLGLHCTCRKILTQTD